MTIGYLEWTWWAPGGGNALAFKPPLMRPAGAIPVELLCKCSTQAYGWLSTLMTLLW